MPLSNDELAVLADPAGDLDQIQAWPFEAAPAEAWSSAEGERFWEAMGHRVRAVSGYVPQAVEQALTRLLEAGYVPPLEVQAWMLAAGKANGEDKLEDELLERWHRRFPGLLEPLATLASKPVLPHASGLRSPLHALVDANAESGGFDELIVRLLQEGADPNARDAAGRPVMALASRLRTVHPLVTAGADPMATADGKGVLLKALAHSAGEANGQRVAAWVTILSEHASPAQRPGVLFDLAQTGQPVILDALMGVWGYQPEDLDRLTASKVTAAGKPARTWTWPGWLAFQALAGLSPTPGRLLTESIARLHGNEQALPAFDRMWLAVLNRHVDPASSNKSLTLSLRFLEDYRKQPAQPGEVGAWALGQPELPIQEGGITRSHPFRAWLVDRLTEQLQSRQPCPGTWRWSALFLMEEAEGEQRMPSPLYTTLRAEVLKHALKNTPQPDDQSLPTVLLALASSLEQASLMTNPSLPSLGAGGGMNLPGDFQAWLDTDWNVATWDPALDACLKRLPQRIRPDQIIQRFGNASPNSKSTWLATWSRLGPKLHARYLEEALMAAPESTPSRKPRL